MNRKFQKDGDLLGYTIRIKADDYTVDKVIWCLVESPGQFGLLIDIKRQRKAYLERKQI